MNPRSYPRETFPIPVERPFDHYTVSTLAKNGKVSISISDRTGQFVPEEVLVVVDRAARVVATRYGGRFPKRTIWAPSRTYRSSSLQIWTIDLIRDPETSVGFERDYEFQYKVSNADAEFPRTIEVKAFGEIRWPLVRVSIVADRDEYLLEREATLALETFAERVREDIRKLRRDL